MVLIFSFNSFQESQKSHYVKIFYYFFKNRVQTRLRNNEKENLDQPTKHIYFHPYIFYINKIVILYLHLFLILSQA